MSKKRVCKSCHIEYLGSTKGKAICRPCKGAARKAAKAKKKAERLAKAAALPPHECRMCGEEKARKEFPDMVHPSICRTCTNRRRKVKRGQDRREPWWENCSVEERRAYAKRRYQRIKEATPPWQTKEELKELYDEAKENKLHVDHIVPLFHRLVCGLHCKDNLQLLSPRQNRLKSNEFEI